MKKMICFVLPLLVLTLCGEETIHLWSGRVVTLPGNGSWQICAEHGRILASGKGDEPERTHGNGGDAEGCGTPGCIATVVVQEIFAELVILFKEDV